jgi:hypothetical protein
MDDPAGKIRVEEPEVGQSPREVGGYLHLPVLAEARSGACFNYATICLEQDTPPIAQHQANTYLAMQWAGGGTDDDVAQRPLEIAPIGRVRCTT